MGIGDWGLGIGPNPQNFLKTKESQHQKILSAFQYPFMITLYLAEL